MPTPTNLICLDCGGVFTTIKKPEDLPKSYICPNCTTNALIRKTNELLEELIALSQKSKRGKKDANL